MAKWRGDSKRFSKALGLKIRALREARGWTLEQTEEFGWPSWTHLQRIESGKNMTIATLVRVANLFGMHPSELLMDV
jgi:transcriptional regulator with XRE-family HTH domain